MTNGLKIAKKLTLPLDLVVEATAVIGKRGRGKTYASKRIVEETHRAGVTVLVIDPTDVWWGLRSGADGSDKGGLDIVVFGGKHGDLPARPGTGKMLARLVLDGTSVVLVTKGLVKADRRRLVGELLTELYDRADGRPILVVIDEADEYAPQGGQSYGGNRRDDPLVLSLGAVEDIVRRGRAGGLGSLLITQRVAVLSKNVLEQSDTLVALGVTGKNDIDAVAGWIAKHAADVETGREITASLPGLPRGTAWVWSPEYDILERVEILPITTYDSSRSPKVGEVIVAPKGRKTIDLAVLGEEMERFADEVKADDPRELRKQISMLREELALRDRALQAEQSKPSTVEHVEVQVPVQVPVPVLDEKLLIRLEEALTSSTLVDVLSEVQERLVWETEHRGDSIEFTRRMRQDVPRTGTAGDGAHPVGAGRRPAKRTDPPSRREPDRPPVPRATKTEGSDSARLVSARSLGDDEYASDGGRLSDSQAAVLDALAWFSSVRILAPTRGQVAFQAGVSPKSSGFEKNLSTLRTRGLIDYPLPNRLKLTGLGEARATPPSTPATSEALQAAIMSRLSGSQQAIVHALIDVYPGSLSREELADRAGVSPQSSGFEKNCSTLRGLGLADYPQQGTVAATDLLFID